MTLNTKGFVKYSVLVVIIATVMWGCKKNEQPEDKSTPPPDNEISLPRPEVESTPPPVEDAEMIEKIKDAAADRNIAIDKIASSAQGWNAALNKYYDKAAPNMKLKDINGKSLSISALKGTNTVIVKWITKNELAVEMVQTLSDLQNELGKENLAVIAISSENPETLKPIAESMNIQFPLIGRPHRLVDPYRTIRDTPVCFFIDKAGKIRLITQKSIPAEIVKTILNAM